MGNIGLGKDTQDCLSGCFGMLVRGINKSIRYCLKQTGKANELLLNDVISYNYHNEKLKPLIKEVENTDNRQVFSVHIPPGLDFDKLMELEDKFSIALGTRVNVVRYLNRFTIEVIKNALPDVVKFDYEEIFPTLKGYVPCCLGKTIEGEWYTLDLTKAPHFLCGGNTGKGKSVFASNLLTCCLLGSPNTKVYVIDYKRLEYSHLRKYGVEIVWDDEQSTDLLTRLNKELDDRMEILDKSKCDNIQTYMSKGNTDMQFILLLIDELAEMDSGTKLLNRLLRLGRACGFVIVGCSQRLSADMVKQFSNSRSLFAGRVGFSVATAEDSKMIGVTGAEKLKMPGTAIVNLFDEVTVQIPFLPSYEADKVLSAYYTGELKDEEVDQDGLPKIWLEA